MKTSISHVISFITMILISILTIFIIVEVSIRDSIILKRLDSMYYYKSAYDNIVYKIDKEIVNEKISNEYKDYISEELIKKDINKIINTRNSISYYSDFYDIAAKYTKDPEICNRYANVVNNIYSKNIFPLKEYKIIRKIYIRTKTCISYALVFLSMIMILELALYIINRNFKYHKITVLSSSILNIFPFIFINVLGAFTHFFYTNTYFTDFLVSTINCVINSLFTMGFAVCIVFLALSIFKIKK